MVKLPLTLKEVMLMVTHWELILALAGLQSDVCFVVQSTGIECWASLISVLELSQN